MTIGIYKLVFKGTYLIYIGKSINIEDRYKQHIYNLSNNNNSSSKLEWAYNLYGKPNYEILLECTEPELDINEIQLISLFNSYEKGLNTLIGGGFTPTMRGTDNPNSEYKDEDYYNVLYFLGQPGYTTKEIAEITGVSKYVVIHIAAEESHLWLKEKYPTEYKDMQELSKKTIKGSERGTVYPKVKSPDGIIYEVHHQTNFAKEHNLLQPKLSEVLHGTRNHHKGWTLA